MDEEVPSGPTLLLVRHGRTAWNAERRFLGTTDMPLDDMGRSEAASLGHALGGQFIGVYASPLRRARETAEALGKEPERVDDLRELHQGELEGLPAPEAIARYPAFFRAWVEDPATCVVPGGESLSACRDRALAALESVADRHGPGQVVAVVTHQMVIASVACTLLGQALREWRGHGVRNVAVTGLRRTAEGWRVLFEDWRFDDPLGPGSSNV